MIGTAVSSRNGHHTRDITTQAPYPTSSRMSYASPLTNCRSWLKRAWRRSRRSSSCTRCCTNSERKGASVRIHAVSVEHFGCIRAASVAFGPGLNVLYGPNDLGKSTLAEALRAVLLLPSTSSEYKSFVPSGTDNVPKVVLTFEAEEGAGEWRITKTFG